MLLTIELHFSIILFLNQSPTAAALITEKDVDGFSPVHYAAKTGDLKVHFYIHDLFMNLFLYYLVKY